ncbi:MAG: hypothetical protein HFJ79_00290 [Clostridiales bacterium]|jgi:hypothetical protein|nr:hypothetical protein [Clostridiales bacterium]
MDLSSFKDGLIGNKNNGGPVGFRRWKSVPHISCHDNTFPPGCKYENPAFSMSFLLIKMSASQKGLKTGKNGDIRPQGSGRAKGPARSRLFVPSAAARPPETH